MMSIGYVKILYFFYFFWGEGVYRDIGVDSPALQEVRFSRNWRLKMNTQYKHLVLSGLFALFASGTLLAGQTPVGEREFKNHCAGCH